MVGFTFAPFKKTTFDPTKNPDFPRGLSISPNRKPAWTESLTAISFGIHEPQRKKAGMTLDEAAPKPDAADTADTPDSPKMLVWHFKDKRLAPM